MELIFLLLVTVSFIGIPVSQSSDLEDFCDSDNIDQFGQHVCDLYWAEIESSNELIDLKSVESKYISHLFRHQQNNPGSCSSSRTKRQEPSNQLPLQFKFVMDIIRENAVSRVAFIVGEMFEQELNVKVEMIKLWKTLSKENVSAAFYFIDDQQSENIMLDFVQSNSRMTYFISLFSDTNLDDILLKISQIGGFQQSESLWFVDEPENVTKSDWFTGLVRDGLYLSINSQFFAVNFDKEIVALTEAYQRAATFHVESKHWGIWTEKSGLVNIQSPIYERRKNLTGIMIPAASASDMPYIESVLIPGSSKYHAISGYQGDIWKALQRICNFSYTVIDSIDGGWGNMLPNGSFNGMVGMLQRKEIEVAISSFFTNPDRAKVAEFSTVLLPSLVKLAIKTPSADGGWLTYINPLSPTMWISTFFMLVIGGMALTLTKHFDPESRLNNEPSILTAFRCLCQQGSPMDFAPLSSRIAFLTIFGSALVIYASYGASLTSFLAISKVSLPFDSLSNLYYKTSFKMGSIPGTMFEDIFMKGTGLFKNIYEERYTNVPNVNEGLRRVDEEDFALLWQVDSVDAVVGLTCKVVYAPEAILTGKMVFLYQKNYQYTHLFNYFLGKMQESGQLNRIWSNWKPRKRNDCFAITEATGLSILTLKSAFVIFCIFLGVSIVIFCLEKLLVKTTANQKES